jgi:hypothetical protein
MRNNGKISLDRDGSVRELPEWVADVLYVTPEGYFFGDAYQEEHGPFSTLGEAVATLDKWVTDNL